MIGRVNTGGGGSGGTLTVTGVAGHTVTATKDGKTYTRTFNSRGVVVFKGLSTGTWTLTMTGDGQTATLTVDVTADYAVTITYFSATIAVTYPEGSTCTCTDGTTMLTAVGTTGSYTFTVPNTGDWTVSCTDGSSTASKAVSITADGQSENVILTYELILLDGTSGRDNWKLDPYLDAKVSFVDDGIALTGNPAAAGIVTNDLIDLSGYKTLKIVYYNTITTDSNRKTLGVGNSNSMYMYAYDWQSYIESTKGTNTELSLDIQAITSGYVGFICKNGYKTVVTKVIAIP